MNLALVVQGKSINNVTVKSVKKTPINHECGVSKQGVITIRIKLRLNDNLEILEPQRGDHSQGVITPGLHKTFA